MDENNESLNELRTELPLDPTKEGLMETITIVPNSGDSDEPDHLIPGQADHQFRGKLTRGFRDKLTTLNV